MLYNRVEFIYTKRYKLNTHFYVKGRISVTFFFGLFAGLFHLVQSIQSQACNSQSTSCKCTKHPFIGLLEKKSDSWNNKQQQTFSFCTAAPGSTSSTELCCHPFRAQPDKTQLSDHGVIITAWDSRSAAGEWGGGGGFTVVSKILPLCHILDTSLV